MTKLHRAHHLLQLCCLVIFCTSYANMAHADNAVPESEPVILHVTLNGMDAGSHFLRLSRDGDVQVSPAQLVDIGLTHTPIEIKDEKKTLSLDAMKPWLTYTLDSSSGELALQVEPSYLPETNYKIKPREATHAQRIQNNAMFVNYALTYRKDPISSGIFSSPVELGVNIEGISLANNWMYQQGKPTYRTQSLMVYDYRDNLQRWSIGDINGSSGSGIGGASLGGISLSKNYAMQPNIFTSPPLQLNTVLLTPSEVEVVIDGVSVFKHNFPAGKLNLANIPYYRSGSSQAKIIVRDSFGREQVYTQELYTSSSLLAPGFSRYHYALGKEQTRTTDGLLSYGQQPLLFGSHQIGVTDWLTSGFGFETDGKNTRGGLLGSLLLGNYGQLDFIAAVSKVNGTSGHFTHFNYNYSGFISPNLFFTKQSSEYRGILEPLANDNAVLWHGGLGISAPLGSWGSISGRWSKKQDSSLMHTQTSSIFVNANLPLSNSLTTQFERSNVEQQLPSDQFNMTLSHYFKNGVFLSANINRANNINALGIQIQFSPPLGKGFGYSANTTSRAHENTTANTRIQYRNQYAEFTAGSAGHLNASTYDVQMSSAFLWADNDIYITRPIRDSFALVRVNGIHDVQVNIHHQPIGETNQHGEMVVPFIYAYTDNTISIDPDIIPLGYKIESTSKQVTSSYRSGGVVEFNVIKMQTIEGEAYYRTNGKLEPAKYSIIEIGEGNNKTRSIIGDGSLLYLENIAAGTYPARLFNKSRSCQFELIIPESDHIVNDIGNVICDTNEKK